MHHVLVAVDGSDWSEVAVRYALDFARLGRCDVKGIAVIPAGVLRAMGVSPQDPNFGTRTPAVQQFGERAVNDWFAGAERLCQTADLCFERVIDVGKPADRLLRAAMTAHLTVFGRHGANAPPDGAGMGRVAARMLRSAIKPMLVTTREYRPIEKVLLGWGGASGSAHAAEMISALAKAASWKVYVVTGADIATPLALSCPYIAEEMAREGVDAEAYVSHVSAPTVIFDAVRRFEPDLLVIGAQRKGAGSALWFGQAWREIVEQVDIPVLLYR